MKKFVAAVLTVVLTFSLFTACGGGSSSSGSGDPVQSSGEPAAGGGNQAAEQIMNFNLAASPKTIDPAKNSAVDGSHIINNTFEGLYRDVKGEIKPASAISHTTNDDKTVYTFTLRDGLKWSDGSPLGAEDFVNAWRRVVSPTVASDYATIINPVKNAAAIIDGQMDPSELGVKAIDAKTLEVTLEEPCSYFEALLYFPTLMPTKADVVDDEGTWAFDPAKAISNGPFKLSEYKIDDKIVLVKNENYWNAENVTLEQINVAMIVEESTTLTAFRAGEIHIADRAPIEEIPQLAASGELTFTDYMSTYFIAFNLTDDVEALKDPRVIKALSLAIDRDQLCNNILRAGQRPATGLVSDAGFKDPVTGKEFREIAGDYGIKSTPEIEEAKALLEEAGYPNGEGIKFTYVYNTNERHKTVAESLQEMWKTNLGVEVELKNSEWSVFLTERKELKYTGAARHGWVGDYADPMTFLDLFLQNNINGCTGFGSQEYDDILARASADTENPYAIYKEAEAVLMEEAGIIPLFYDTKYVLVNNDVVTGWDMSTTGKFWFGDVVMMDEEA